MAHGKVHQLSHWLAAAAIAGAMSVGCSGGVAVHMPPPSAEKELIAIDEQHPPHLIGAERIAADMTILGLSAGRLEAKLDAVCDGDRKQLRMTTAMKTVGVVRFLARRDGEATSEIDPQTATPQATSIWMDDGSDLRKYRVQYQPGTFSYTYERTDHPTKEGLDPVPGGEHAHDLQSSVILLRSWRPKAGKRGYFHVVLGYRVWRADVVYRGPEAIEVAGVSQRAVRVEGLAHKLLRKPKDDDKPRKFALWFSDDPQRVPLRVMSEARFGTVQLDLTAHESRPGDLECQKAHAKAHDQPGAQADAHDEKAQAILLDQKEQDP